MNRNVIIIVVLVLALLGLGAFLFLGKRGSGGTAVSGTMCANRPEPLKVDNASVTELKIEDVKEGSGAQAITSNKVKVNYIGRLTDGKQFDTSCDRGQPFEFVLGQGQVIPGWDSGIVGMRVGGQRRLIIPPSLGYGDRGAGADIPPGAALVFDVELLAIE